MQNSVNLHMTGQNLWHMRLFEHFIKVLSLSLEPGIRIRTNSEWYDPDSDPNQSDKQDLDPHQSDKQDPDPHQRDADPQHRL